MKYARIFDVLPANSEGTLWDVVAYTNGHQSYGYFNMSTEEMIRCRENMISLGYTERLDG